MKCSKCQFDNPDATNFCGKCGTPLTADARMADSLTKTLATPLQVIAKDKLIAGKYRIIEEAGAGGMGIVYRAEDLKLKRCVALKFLPPRLMDSLELRERFLIEARAAAALSHPNICVIYEVGESEERPYIAMEYVEGETLRERIRKGPVNTEEALAFSAQIAGGLAEAHHKGIIHRDIKSANIMVTEKGQAKVMDFGLAKLRGGSSLTKSQTTLGTVAYMSPEQARGENLDGRTDIWSLGVVLYELLAGKLPFRDDHDQTVIYSILHQEPESLTKLRPGLAPELERVVGQAMTKKLAERYRTMEEFREDLAALAEGLHPLRAKARPAAVKLAVLPFVNLTGDPEQEYLSDGLTQEMITQMGRLQPESLGVIARTSVMRYKKSDASIDQIGRELGVDYVLEGSARREGIRLRVSANLIQVRDQIQLWGDIFEREMSGILKLQSEVAQKVAGALAVRLLPSEQARLARARTVNPEAYEAYLNALQSYIALTPADLDTAERYCRLALEKDPDSAPAYAVQSLVWAARQQIGLTTPAEAGPKAKAAARKAIELDETGSDAHYALAVVLTWTDWDFAAAEPEWRRTLELNPGNADALAMTSRFLMHLNRPEEAMTMIDRALKRDPFNIMVLGFYAIDLLFARRYDECIEAAREVLRAQPGYPLAQTALWMAHSAKAMPREAADGAKGVLMGSYADEGLVAVLERGYAQGGYTVAMKRAADALVGRFQVSYALPTDIAFFYLEAGERAKALEWLEKGFEVRDPSMPYLGFPTFDSIRPDPRFQDLVRRMWGAKI